MKLKFNIPINWNRLTDHQLLKVATLFFSPKEAFLFDFTLLKIMANHKWYKPWLIGKIILLFKNVPIKTIKEHYGFIYKEQNLTRFIPSVKIKTKWYKKAIKYYAPADRLTNLSIGEFSLCEDLYLGYLRNCKNTDANYGYSYLIYLFAVLYIEKGLSKRPKFQKENLGNYVAAIKNVPKKYVYACLLSYKGCRDAVTTNPKYKHIFPNKKADPNTVLKIPASSGFSDIILSFSGKLFGDYDKTFTTNLYTFLDGYEIALKNIPKENTK
ncbi:MAG: hypothetical protein WC389_00240 [Lutibacter sp.]|jgi:hypothetical protein